MYIFAAFASSFPYPGVEVGTIATGIVVAGVVAYKGKNNKLRGRIGWNIGKVVIVVLLGVNWGIRFYRVLYVKPRINILVSILDLKVLLDYSL